MCSSARLLANQANAKRSTGPKTEEGKARSRANALKHGLTGEGVALPDEDAAEVARRFESLQAEMNPSGTMGRILVRRIAFLSVRLERCEEHDSAIVGEKVRHAVDDHDLGRDVEAATLIGSIGDDPSVVARKLLRTPEGVDATIAALLDLKEDLGRPGPQFWTAAHCERANNLTGRRMDDIPVSRINILSSAIWGDFGMLGVDEGSGLDDDARRAWARAELVELIDDEIRANREYLQTLDLEAFEVDRAEAGKRALFDTSKEATLARRYEAATERGIFRALKELRQVELEAAENPRPVPAPVPTPAQLDGPLASFGAGDLARPEEPNGLEIEPRERPAAARRSPRVELRPEIDVTLPSEGFGEPIPARRCG